MAAGLLYVCSGESIPVTVHDQLDDIVPKCELRAEHWGEEMYPELMGGQPSWSASIGILGMNLFYLLFPSVVAFSLNTVFVMLVSYLSMYGCLLIMRVRHWIAALTAFMFACLPAYTVYGLSCMGIPLVVLAVLVGWNEKPAWVAFVLTAIYGFWSSLVWVGYAVCFLLFIIAVILILRGRRKQALQIALLLAFLIVIYVVENLDLIIGALSSDVVSHRVEFDTESSAFSPLGALQLFVTGQYHAVSHHQFLLCSMVAVVTLLAVWAIWLRVRKQEHLPEKLQRLACAIVVLLLLAFVFALFENFYSSHAADFIRGLLPSSLRSLQIERFYWLYPTLWFIGGALSFEAIMDITRLFKAPLLGVMIVLIASVATLSLSIPENNVFKNVKDVVIDHGHDSMTWEQVYAEDLFAQIREDLNEREGGDPSSYRVGSVGMHPLVALHNGFYTVDGYSTNYPLEYKHRFARIIEKELDSSPAIHDYYWKWGGRCYLFSHEIGNEFLLPKDSGVSIKDFKMDMDAFKEMEGDYILSAAPIENASECGLELVGEYEHDMSLYTVYVYEAV